MSQHSLSAVARGAAIVAAVLVFVLAGIVLMVGLLGSAFIDEIPDGGACQASRRGWAWLEVGVAFVAVLVAAYAIVAAVRARRTLVATAVAIAATVALDVTWFSVLVAIPDPVTVPC